MNLFRKLMNSLSAHQWLSEFIMKSLEIYPKNLECINSLSAQCKLSEFIINYQKCMN